MRNNCLKIYNHVQYNLQVEAMIEEADIDGDGSINYAEFFVMVGKTLAKMGRE